MAMTANRTFRLSDGFVAALDELGEAMGCNRTEVLRRAVDHFGRSYREARDWVEDDVARLRAAYGDDTQLRLEGSSAFVEDARLPDYLVFWQADNEDIRWYLRHRDAPVAATMRVGTTGKAWWGDITVRIGDLGVQRLEFWSPPTETEREVHQAAPEIFRSILRDVQAFVDEGNALLPAVYAAVARGLSRFDPDVQHKVQELRVTGVTGESDIWSEADRIWADHQRVAIGDYTRDELADVRSNYAPRPDYLDDYATLSAS
jgi:predicted transcriptional regulator